MDSTMGKLVGIVGKPNCGKTTFLNAATLANAPVGAYPFTTIKANRGIGYVRAKCPCKEFETKCSPKNSNCVDGERFIPIELLDVAGLVPGAHKGKGLGNQFLDDLRQADALIHIIDAAGATDSEGKMCEPGTHNPLDDVKFLEDELNLWFLALVKKNWKKISRDVQFGKKKVYKELAEKFSGLGITEGHILHAIKDNDLNIGKPAEWSDSELEQFAKSLRKNSKPIIICANKCDLKEAKELARNLDGHGVVVQCSADSELALRRAAEKNLIEYTPGDSDFKIVEDSGIDEKQKQALLFIKENVIQKLGATGVQQTLNKVAFEVLDLIVVYPVEDENKFRDKHGNVLPDAYLVPKGTTTKEFAYKIHTDIGENFICGIDARTKMKLSADHELKDGDVIKISYKV